MTAGRFGLLFWTRCVSGGACISIGTSLSEHLKCAAGAASRPVRTTAPKTHVAMTRTAVLLAITVASSLVIQSLAQGVNVSCVFTHPLASDETSYSFLVMDSELPSASPRLYLVSWRYSRLHRCTWSDHQAEVQSYTSLCRESTHSFSKWLDDNVNITSIIRSEGVCQRAGKLQARRLRGHSTTLPQVVGGGSGVRSPARVKRGFIFPGTLWCGSGNKALSQENLGELVLNELKIHDSIHFMGHQHLVFKLYIC